MHTRVTTTVLHEQKYFTPFRLFLMGIIVLSVILGIAINMVNPTLVVGVVGVLILAVTMLFQPFLGALAYVVFEYARLQSMFPALQVLQIGKLIMLPTLAIWLIHSIALKRQLRLVNDSIYSYFALWLALGLVSAIFAFSTSLASDRLIDLGKWLVTSFLLIHLLNSLAKWQIFMWVYLLLNLKLSQFQIRGYASGIGTVSNQDFFIHQGVGGGSAFFANATDFGMAMVVVIPLALYLAKSCRTTILKLLATGMTIAFALSILMSGSRGAALALFVMAIAFWIKSGRQFIHLALVVLFIAGFWVSAPDAWQERFISAKDYEEDATASHRIDLWKAGVRMARDHPVTGVGLGNFATAYNSSYRPAAIQGGATAPHSIYIEALSELGIGGLIVLLGIFLMLYRRNAESRKLYRRANLDEPWLLYCSHALDLSLLGYAVGGAFLTVLYYPHLFMIIALTISLHHIVRKKAKAKELQATGGTG